MFVHSADTEVLDVFLPSQLIRLFFDLCWAGVAFQTAVIIATKVKEDDVIILLNIWQPCNMH
jgi:hypothetical protein